MVYMLLTQHKIQFVFTVIKERFFQFSGVAHLCLFISFWTIDLLVWYLLVRFVAGFGVSMGYIDNKHIE